MVFVPIKFTELPLLEKLQPTSFSCSSGFSFSSIIWLFPFLYWYCWKSRSMMNFFSSPWQQKPVVLTQFFTKVTMNFHASETQLFLEYNGVSCLKLSEVVCVWWLTTTIWHDIYQSQEFKPPFIRPTIRRRLPLLSPCTDCDLVHCAKYLVRSHKWVSLLVLLPAKKLPECNALGVWGPLLKIWRGLHKSSLLGCRSPNWFTWCLSDAYVLLTSHKHFWN